MAVYRKIIDLMGLQPTHQNKYGQWYMLLAALDTMESVHPTPEPYANPWKEFLTGFGLSRAPIRTWSWRRSLEQEYRSELALRAWPISASRPKRC